MKALIYFAAIIVLLSSYEIIVQNDPYASPNNPSLTEIRQADLKQFANQTGDKLDQNRLRTMINLINNASTFYKDDIEMNLQYIKTNLDASVSATPSTFYVVIDNGNTKANQSSQIFHYYTTIVNQKVYASFGKGINLKNPTWSYLIYADTTRNETFYTLSYIPSTLGRGPGMNKTMENQIKFVIQANEGDGPCNCKSTQLIKTGIGKATSYNWNVFCRADESIHSYVGIYK